MTRPEFLHVIFPFKCLVQSIDMSLDLSGLMGTSQDWQLLR